MKSLLPGYLCFLLTLPLLATDYQHVVGNPAIKARAEWEELTRGENLALGKPVVFSKKPNYRLTTSASDAYDLTSGKLSSRQDDRIWFDRDAVGWTGADAGVNATIDLGAAQPVDRVVIRLLGGREQRGLVYPSEITLFGSLDGKQFFRLKNRVKVTFSEKELMERDADRYFFLPEDGVAAVHSFAFSILRTVRYIGVEMKSPTGFLFSDQIAVIKAGDGVQCADLTGLEPVQFISSGLSIRPKHDELVISTNVPTPNFFRITDSREEPDESPIRFIFDLPAGISVTMGPHGEAYPQFTDSKNRWVIEKLYKGKGVNGSFGPFYFTLKDGATLPEGATASFSVDRADSASNIIVIPVRTVEIPQVPPLDDLDISLAWMEEKYAYTYPRFFDAFRHLGFNTVATFPRNHTQPQARARLVEFAEEARKEGFRVLYNESPFHVMWKTGKEIPELRNQINGKPGNHACPSYTGEYYRKEIARVAENAKAIRPDSVFFDIEFWHDPAVEAAKCSVCQQAFEKWGKGDWDSYLRAQGTRMTRDLVDAVAGTAHGGKTPTSGLYGLHSERPIYHKVHDLYAIHPKIVPLVQPSLYVQGNARTVHEVLRANYEKVGPRKMLPWLTAGTYGEFPPHRVEQMVLEALLNGSRGVTYYAFWDFEPMDFYYHARALQMVAPFQALLKNGTLQAISGSNPALVYTAFGSEQQALVLVGNYGSQEEAMTKLGFEGRDIKKIVDLHSQSPLAKEELTVPADGHRLLLVAFQ